MSCDANRRGRGGSGENAGYLAIRCSAEIGPESRGSRQDECRAIGKNIETDSAKILSRENRECVLLTNKRRNSTKHRLLPTTCRSLKLISGLSSRHLERQQHASRCKPYRIARNYPFEFSTEASVNLADDDSLLQMMRSANFFGVFVGIESPDPETLVAMKKKQNTRRDLVASIHKIYAAGMFVTAGFILGFDSEKASVSDAVVKFIEDSAIPMCMVGLLYALPNTQLTRRLANEGRLHLGHDVAAVTGGDQCTTGLNFETLRPLRDVLEDYKRVLEQIYEPTAYAGRLERFASLLNREGSRRDLPEGDVRGRTSVLELMHRVVTALPETREPFWRVFTACARDNLSAVRIVVAFMVLYLHLRPFSRLVIAAIDRRIAALDGQAPPIEGKPSAAACREAMPAGPIA